MLGLFFFFNREAYFSTLPLYVTEYGSTFSTGDPTDKEMTHDQLNVTFE